MGQVYFTVAVMVPEVVGTVGLTRMTGVVVVGTVGVIAGGGVTGVVVFILQVEPERV